MVAAAVEEMWPWDRMMGGGPEGKPDGRAGCVLKAAEQGPGVQGEQRERDEFGKFKGQKRRGGLDQREGGGGPCGMAQRGHKSEPVSSAVKRDSRVIEVLQGDAVCRGRGLLGVSILFAAPQTRPPSSANPCPVWIYHWAWMRTPQMPP